MKFIPTRDFYRSKQYIDTKPQSSWWLCLEVFFCHADKPTIVSSISPKTNVCTRGLFCPCGGQSIYKKRSRTEHMRDKREIFELTTLRVLVSIQFVSGWPRFAFTPLPIMDDQAVPGERLPAAVQRCEENSSEVIWLHVRGKWSEQIDEQTHASCRTLNPLTWTLHLHC